MAQYRHVFRTVRVPGHPFDRLSCNFVTAREERARGLARHRPFVLVSRRGHWWKLHVEHPAAATARTAGAPGRPLTGAEVLAQLRSIAAEADGAALGPPAVAPVGWLSALGGQERARAFGALARHAACNAASLAAFNDALMVLQLDTGPPIARKDARVVEASVPGARGLADRWCDHSNQTVIFSDGTVGGSMEHSAFDGAPMIRMLEENAKWVAAYVQRPDALRERPLRPSMAPPARLAWDLATPGTDMRALAAEGCRRAMEASANWDLKCARVDGIGRAFLKRAKVSPDSFFQLALQLAYTRCHGGQTASTYESVVTLRFYKGRTETGRTVSSDTVAFCKAMTDGGEGGGVSSAARKASLLRAAAKAHGRTVAAAASGQGVDRHLFALRIAALEGGTEPPALLDDPLVARASGWQLSTSQVVAPHAHDGPVTFHPVHAESTGICYGIYGDHSWMTVMTTRSCKETDSAAFLAALEGALREMAGLLLEEEQRKRRQAASKL